MIDRRMLGLFVELEYFTEEITEALELIKKAKESALDANPDLSESDCFLDAQGCINSLNLSLKTLKDYVDTYSPIS